LEKLVIIIAAIALLVLVALFILGYRSQSGEAFGLVEGRLKPCPDTPNCVSSEPVTDPSRLVEALEYSQDQAAQVMPRLKTIIRDMGGIIQVEQADYLAASFTSPIFRFVDDLEARVDSAQNIIHLRSASRVGRKDFGVNRKRVEHLGKAFYRQSG
jgi:uncharacterized protein (DUF1499 family)